jgi:hypothetical protein
MSDFDFSGFIGDDVTLLGAFYDPTLTPLAPPVLRVPLLAASSAPPGANDELITLLADSIITDTEGARREHNYLRLAAGRTSHPADSLWADGQRRTSEAAHRQSSPNSPSRLRTSAKFQN